MSPPADFAVTLPVLSGTTTRKAPRCAWSRASSLAAPSRSMVSSAIAGTAEEIGVMVAFLASDVSAYTTGTIITIDGGAANRGPMF